MKLKQFLNEADTKGKVEGILNHNIEKLEQEINFAKKADRKGLERLVNIISRDLKINKSSEQPKKSDNIAYLMWKYKRDEVRLTDKQLRKILVNYLEEAQENFNLIAGKRKEKRVVSSTYAKAIYDAGTGKTGESVKTRFSFDDKLLRKYDKMKNETT